MSDLTDDGLTWEQCDEFRRTPGSFNDMVQTIYRAGLAAGRERAIEECADLCDDMALYTGVDCANAIRALKDAANGTPGKP